MVIFNNLFKNKKEKQLVNKIENILLEMGFERVKINLAQTMEVGISEIDCYKKEQLYCRINVFDFGDKSKRLVVIEYAYSLYEAERILFDDGVPIYVDTPIKKILDIIRKEIANRLL